MSYHDPYVTEFTWQGRHYTSVELTDEVISSADLVIITTGHTVIDYNRVIKHARLVFDTRNATKGVEDTEHKVYRL